jgi:hypothetical protein
MLPRTEVRTQRPARPELRRAWVSALVAACAFSALACGGRREAPPVARSGSASSAPVKAPSPALPPDGSGPQEDDDGTGDIAALLQDEVAEAETRLAATRGELAQLRARWEACRGGIQPTQTGGWGGHAAEIAQLIECDTLRNRALQLESTARLQEIELSFARMAGEPGGLEKLAQKARQLGLLRAGRAVEREAWQRFLAQERATYVQYYDAIGRNPYPTPPVGPIGMDKPSPRE